MPITVAAIIPTYNRVHCISEAVESVLSQSLLCDEIIVVDDGSTDRTPEVLAPYSQRVRLIRQENRGVSAARNTGVRAAKSEWVAFLDSDDLWYKDRIESLHRSIAKFPDVVLQAGDTMLQTRGGSLLSHYAIKGASFTGVRRVDRPLVSVALPLQIATPAVAVRASCFERCSFNEEMRFAEDQDLWLQLAMEGPWALCAAPASLARRLPETTSKLSNLAVDKRAYALRCRCQMLARATRHPRLTSQEEAMLRKVLAGCLRSLSLVEAQGAFPSRLRLLRESVTQGRSLRAAALACLWALFGKHIERRYESKAGYRRTSESS